MGATGTQTSWHDPSNFFKNIYGKRFLFLCETYHTFLLANGLKFKLTGTLISLEVVRFRVS